MNNCFPEYTTDYISGVMSLRKPQKKSLEILDNILTHIQPTKNMDLAAALAKVHSLYPICKNFERDFMSLSFVLATGVGKTRLMGSFITLLYAKYHIKNFFVVAPGNTVYNKLKKDLGDPSHPKYVFNGAGCFNNPPKIITNEDYRNRNLSFLDGNVNIFIFNISKFDKENVKMRAVNEYLGDSFFNQLAKIDTLVMIMDEAHHYHADKGAMALNELKPILGLELTATPFYNKGAKQVPFGNAVYEYPLSASIKDGYTRTPYAVTRKDISFYNFGEDDLDKAMLTDGLICHENIKQKLAIYAENNQKTKIKPFVMVVCKDTEHATNIFNYVTSDVFQAGAYKNKTLLIHSNQSKAKREANIQLLLSVESFNNPIEIVIHVDMLKEGWDVNNLYTIIPLRTAASRILREQMVGRGLRLPYGERVGVKEIDAVMLTAHDKFDDILKEAQKGDSIFKSGNVILAEEIEKQETTVTQIAVTFPDESVSNAIQKIGVENTQENINAIKQIQNKIQKITIREFTKADDSKKDIDQNKINQEVKQEIKNNKDLSSIYEKNKAPFSEWIKEEIVNYTDKINDKFIPIPQIKVTDLGIEEYRFNDFDLDVSKLNQIPVDNDLLIQNLENMSDRLQIKGGHIDFLVYHPNKDILEQLREKAEIDYEKCAVLLNKLIKQAIAHYEEKFGLNGMKNIVMMNKRNIADEIYTQMLKKEHFYHDNGFLQEEVVALHSKNRASAYEYASCKNLYEEPEGTIGSTLFEGIQKGVFVSAKFDSHPELVFARVIEHDTDVINWLRPNRLEFNIYYNQGKRYEPDFVVETRNIIYLVEVKGEDKLNDPDVLAKKERAIKYCKIVSDWGKANGYKEWRYLFIPAKQIQSNSRFITLAMRFDQP